MPAINSISISSVSKALKGLIPLIIFTFSVLPAWTQTTPDEYQIKGAFLFNFAQFTDWPPGAFPSSDAPFVIGFLGGDPFGKFMEEMVRGETVEGRPILLKRFTRADDIEAVHLLFVHRNFDISRQQIKNLNASHVFTIGDAPGFAEKGGIINFFKEDNKVRFEVNLEAAKTANLALSSKLLRLAKICCNSGN